MIEDYVRNATVTRVVDGDTLDVQIDLGFYISVTRRLRVLGVDTPEMTGPTKEAGIKAKEFTEHWLRRYILPGTVPTGVTVKTYLVREQDSFGRVLAEIWLGGQSLAAALIASGNGAPRFAEAEQYGALASISKECS